VNCGVYAGENILAAFPDDEDFAVLGAGDYFEADTGVFASVDNNLNTVDTVIVPGELGGFLFGVFFDVLRDAQVFAGNFEKQCSSP